MKRCFATGCALVTALVFPAIAAAVPVAGGAATGTVTAMSDASFTIQTAGRRVGMVNALVTAANNVTQRDYPYVYGGGHAQAGIASTGVKLRGHRVGFDCSGSVAAVLAGAGLWPAGSGVPSDAGVIATLRQEGLIARGVGKGPVEVTLYDRPGVHIFMNIDGRFFGTSDGGGGGNHKGGAGWLDDGAPDASRSVYKPYHFLPSVLRSSTNAGNIISFQLADLSPPPVLQVGDSVDVTYQEDRAGSLFATTLAFPGAVTTVGTVGTIAPDASSFTLQTSSGSELTLSVLYPQLIQNLAAGDTVQVMYTASGTTLILRSLTVTATAPAPVPSPGTPTPPPSPGSSGPGTPSGSPGGASSSATG